MKAAQRVLVAVDDSEQANRVAAYVGRMLSGAENIHIRLFHIVEPVAPLFTAVHGNLETTAAASEGKAVALLIEKAKESSRPILARMASILGEAGIKRESIEDSWYTASREDSLVHEVLELAREQNYETIVVGRTMLPWYRNLFHHHLGERIVKKSEGLSVWVIE